MGTSSTFPLEFFGVILVLCSLIAFVIAKHRHDRALADLSPKHPTGIAPDRQATAFAAVVASKRIYTWPDRIGYYVTFHAGDRHPLEVEVSHDWYSFLSLGDRGQLAVERGYFCGFSRAG